MDRFAKAACISLLFLLLSGGCSVAAYHAAAAVFCSSVTFGLYQAAAATTLHNMALLFKNTGRLEESVQA
jgi:hypothetical protein